MNQHRFADFGIQGKSSESSKVLYRKMTKPKWTLKWMFVISVLIVKVIAISANENTHYLPPLECYDPYGRPQVRTMFIN